MQQGGENSRSPNSYEHLGSCADCAEANMEFVCKTAWDLRETIYKVKGCCFQACEKSFRPPNRNTQVKVVASRSACRNEDGEFIFDSDASLHTMSKSEYTSVEKDSIRRSKRGRVDGRSDSAQSTRTPFSTTCRLGLFGYFAERASPTGYEPKAQQQFEDFTSHVLRRHRVTP